MIKSKLNWVLLMVLATLISAWSYRTAEFLDPPKIKNLKFGSITINGTVYEKDVVIEKGVVRKRKKGPSKPLRDKYGHTPLTPLENIPWDCDTLVIGIGMSGRLPVVKDFKKEAKKRAVTLILLETPKAVNYFVKNYSARTNAIFHITC